MRFKICTIEFARKAEKVMKKILAVSLIILFATTSYVSARTVYDSTGRHVVHDDTIRGQKKEHHSQIETPRRARAAAAAKIDYEAAMRAYESTPKSNFYQDNAKR